MAIDEHRTPFYGDRSAFGVTGGQKKHGTKYAYGYATAVLAALTGGEKPHEVVATLLAQMEARGLKIRGVVLDVSCLTRCRCAARATATTAWFNPG